MKPEIIIVTPKRITFKDIFNSRLHRAILAEVLEGSSTFQVIKALGDNPDFHDTRLIDFEEAYMDVVQFIRENVL